MSELIKSPVELPDVPSPARPRTAGGTAEQAGEETTAGPATSYWKVVCSTYLHNKLAVLGLVIVTVLALTAAFGPFLTPHDAYAQDLNNTMAGPSAEHWFGTDGLGRDLFARLVVGTRLALLIGLASIALTCGVGVLLGALAGYAGRWIDSVIMRTADVFLAFPLLVGAITIILVTGQGVWPVIVALALFSWATVARLLRSSILTVREADYVAAARALGAGHTRIVLRHILPNSISPVLIYAAFNTGTAIVGVASLSFLGIGVAPGVPEWGNILAEGRQFIGVSDHLWVFPSLAIILTVLGFVFVGDGLRDALDPKLR
ncbi:MULTISPECIES: ABC transporter permease [Streptomyces]|uniref:Peptide ABC transporter permease n=1 Tax=Streptomyces venezuelae TaxID=54571 RepID=A0A5P2BFF3_STRVZ|nr:MULTISPECIES: ABC transporter permease [Streptomyces]NEA01343.1 ABC transporter permease [Streptomyces sp. SID10116]MYY87414.1 ABC transporter permease subunit [Streptomyces sp. SID335]MYZ18715.1 ABC transporter permease subunit [Streptomyces sp. SID337]NDZ89627.1 ABC transporter permease [Streptomyces sp. SID10115]NEB45486.1 ABC transporter permease [Streptomyces sp. SID339]